MRPGRSVLGSPRRVVEPAQAAGPRQDHRRPRQSDDRTRAPRSSSRPARATTRSPATRSARSWGSPWRPVATLPSSSRPQSRRSRLRSPCSRRATQPPRSAASSWKSRQSPPASGKGNVALEPLSWQFNHLLVTPDFAARIPGRVGDQERPGERLPQEDSTHGDPVPPRPGPQPDGGAIGPRRRNDGTRERTGRKRRIRRGGPEDDRAAAVRAGRTSGLSQRLA